jgi:hypothetical protein
MKQYPSKIKTQAMTLRSQGIPISKIFLKLNGPSKVTINKWTKSVKPQYICHPLYKTDQIKNDYFSKINLSSHPERFVIIGFLAADGCIYNEGYGQSRLCINLSQKDRCALDLINQEICVGTRNITNNKTTKSCQIYIPSDEICKDLSRYGIIPRKTKNFDIPKITKEKMKYFLRGYFYGDGCYHRYKYRSVYNIIGSNQFGKSLKNYLIKNRIVENCGVYQLKRSPNHSQIVFQGKHAISFGAYIMNNEKMMLLPRKHIIA